MGQWMVDQAAVMNLIPTRGKTRINYELEDVAIVYERIATQARHGALKWNICWPVLALQPD